MDPNQITDEQIQISEEQVKTIAAAITAEIKRAKESGKDPETDAVMKSKIERMVQDQVAALQVASVGRRKGEFETEQEINDDQLEKVFKSVNAMTDTGRMKAQEINMLFSEKRLERKHGRDIAQRIEEFKELSDDAHLISTMLYLASKKSGRHRTFMDVYKNTDIYRTIHDRLKSDWELRKALAVATTGAGAEWIPTGFSSQVLTTVELQLKVASLFPSIAMPTNPWKMPVQTSTGEGYYVPESTADDADKIPASHPGTASPSFNARKLAGRILFSEEIDEDSIVNMRSFITSEMGKMIGRAEETALINGDRTGAAGVASAHQDNGGIALFTSNYDARLAFDGLRYIVLNNAGTATKDFGNADPSDTLMGQVRMLMGKYGVNPADLAWVMSVNTYLKSVNALTNARTIDKYGPKATVLSGELMKYDGIPVIVSEYQFSNLNASGVYDGTTTDRSMLHLVYRPGFMKGTRGGITLNSALDIETDQIKLVGKRRVDFVDPYDATQADHVQVASGINVKTT